MLRAALLGLLAALSLSEAASEPSSKLKKLRKALPHFSVTNVIRLYPSNYTEIAVEGPRDYDLFVFFNAADRKFGCTICTHAAEELITASRSLQTYIAAQGLQDEQDIFFAVTDYGYNTDAFALHGFTTVPHVVFVPRTTEKFKIPKAKSNEAPVPIPRERMLSPSDGQLHPEEIFALMPGNPLASIPILRPAAERARIAFGITVLIALLSSAIAWNRSNVLFFFKKWFWTMMSLSVYTAAVSGVVLCIIRTPPWYGQNQSGKPVIFTGSSGHDQYVLEGLSLGLLNLAAGGSAILAILLAKSRNRGVLTKTILLAVLIGVFIATYEKIIDLYQSKTRWYRTSEIASFGVKLAQNALKRATAKGTYGDLAWQYIMLGVGKFHEIVKFAKISDSV